MKHSEFIELLNLYLDHEISAPDAARLEAEVQTNPSRRAIYQQYCRMQKACKLVVADFQIDSDVGVASDRKVVAFASNGSSARRPNQGQNRRHYVLGSMAAMAACIAIIFAGRNRPEANAALASAPAASQAAAAADVEIKPAFVAGKTGAPRGLVSVAQRPPASTQDPLLFTLLTGNTQAEAVRAAATEQANNQLAWITAVQLTPLQGRVATNNLQFDATLRSEERALGSRASSAVKQPAPADEMTAFQFMK